MVPSPATLNLRTQQIDFPVFTAGDLNIDPITIAVLLTPQNGVKKTPTQGLKSKKRAQKGHKRFACQQNYS